MQRLHVLEGGLQDLRHLLLLVLAGIGAGQGVVHALLDALLELGRVERLAVGLGISETAGGRDEAAGQKGGQASW